MRAIRMSVTISCVSIALAALLAGCVTPPPAPRSVLDERSGASLTVVDRPLILARERRDVAVQARDYLTLVAAEINESGRRRLIWALHQWSTIDARAADEKPLPAATLMLIADGRDMRLVPIADSAAASYAKNRALMAPEDADAVTTLYAVDEATLEFVATSRQLSASFPDSRLSLPFLLWADGRPALLRFLQELKPLK
jgi:hypothetical protein